MIFRRLSLAIALGLTSVPLLAQAPAPIALTRAAIRRESVVRDSIPRHANARGQIARRYAVSAMGATAGAVAGLLVAFDLGTRGCTGPRGFCGIGADYGTTWMTAVLIPGAALGAALPRGARTCPLSRRLLTASGGALVGGGLGALVGSARSRGTMAWLAFGGSTGAATAGAHRCRARTTESDAALTSVGTVGSPHGPVIATNVSQSPEPSMFGASSQKHSLH